MKIGIALFIAIVIGFFAYSFYVSAPANLQDSLEGTTETAIFQMLGIPEDHRGAFNTTVEVTTTKDVTEVKVCFQLNQMKQYQVPAKYRAIVHRICDLDRIGEVNPSATKQFGSANTAAIKIADVLKPYFK